MSYADITRAVGAEHVRDLRREAAESVRASLARCCRRVARPLRRLRTAAQTSAAPGLATCSC